MAASGQADPSGERVLDALRELGGEAHSRAAGPSAPGSQDQGPRDAQGITAGMDQEV